MFKNKLTAVLCLLLAMMIVTPVIACAATVEMAYSGGSLYLRSGPGKDYSAKGTVSDGDYISVQEYGDVWSKVKTSGGKVGYIKNLYINDGDSDYAAGTSYFSSRYSVYTTASVNLRSGAGTHTAVITTLKKGAKLTAMGKNNGFYLVQTPAGTQGYVSGKYITKNKVSSGSSSSSSSSGSSGWTKSVTASYVNMREGGGMSYDVVKVLPRGTKVSVLYVGNYWTRVKHNGVTGWIKNTYLK